MPVRKMLLLGLMLTCAATALSACTSAREAEDGASEDSQTTVRVVNERSEPVEVYVVGSADQRTRLGEVGSASTEVLDIPPSYVNGVTELRFQVEFLNTNRAISQELAVYPGDDVELTVPAF